MADYQILKKLLTKTARINAYTVPARLHSQLRAATDNVHTYVSVHVGSV